MTSEKYFAAETEQTVERERLDLLESIVDPFTIKHLKALGIEKGWKCLEVGAGGGSVARWLAEQVGTTGSVVATDIDAKLLRDLDGPNLTIRQHDIVNDELEQGQYDLVHCRTLLMHLIGYEKALERMAGAVRPGGWLLIEEADMGLVGTADPKHPAAEFFNGISRAVIDVIQEKSIMDPYFGRRVRSLVAGLGFVNGGHDVFVEYYRGGEASARYMQMTAKAVVRPLVTAGLFTEEEYARSQHLYEDPSFFVVGFAWFAAWGQRTR